MAAGAAVARSRYGPALLLALFGVCAIFLVLVMGIVGAVVGLQPATAPGFEPSALARREIPPAYLRLYVQAGERYGIDPWILAAIGSIETQHGRSTAPGRARRCERVRLLRWPDAVSTSAWGMNARCGELAGTMLRALARFAMRS